MSPSTALRFSPFADEVIEDPYPHYARLRAEDPVHHNPDLGLTVLSRYGDVRAAARDHRHFSSGNGVAFARMQIPMMLTIDEPAHQRLRRFVSRDFTPRAVTRWQEVIDALADELVLDLPDRFDFAEAVAAPLPVRLIATVIGVPQSDYPTFKRWSDDIVRGFAVADLSELGPESVVAVSQLAAYTHELIADRRATPRDDLLSMLLEERDGDRLSDDEIVFFFLLLLVAGNETTTNLLSNLVHSLAIHPDQWELLRTGAATPTMATEEALRHNPPIQGFYRDAAEDVEIAGTTIEAGTRVLLLWASANRDEAVYDDPDRFDITRTLTDHTAFGHGIHVCLGAHLARLEVAAVLDRMTSRFETLTLDGPIEPTHNPTIRGFHHLGIQTTRVSGS